MSLRRKAAALLLALLLLLTPGLLVGVPSASAHQPHDPIVAAAVSPAFASDHTIFIATALESITLATQIIQRSTDGGVTWQVVPNFPNFPATAIAISPAYASDQTVFISTLGGGIFKSTDQGETWTVVSGPVGSDATSVVLSPSYATDHTVFAASIDGGLFKSTDGASTWAALPSLPVAAKVLTVSPNYAADQTVFAGTAGSGVYVTTNGGDSWTAMNQGLGTGNETISALALSPSYNRAAPPASQGRSPASLRSWLAKACRHGGTARLCATMHNAAADQTLFAGTLDNGVFASTNGGATWIAVNSGLADTDVRALAISPGYAADSTLFAATASGIVYITTNGGASWAKTAPVPRELSGQTTVHDRALAISPNFAVDHAVFVAMYEGFWESNNEGQSWGYAETLPPTLVRSLSVSPTYSTDHTVIASNYGGGMNISTDGGQSWNVQDVGLDDCYPNATALAPGPGSGAPPAFVGTVWGLEKMAVGSMQWQTLSMLGVRVSLRATATSPAYASDQTVAMGTDYLGTPDPITTTYHGIVVSTDGLFLSHDGGVTWAPTGFNGRPVHSIAFSPNYATDRTIFVSNVDTGLYKSIDGGNTFTPVGGIPGSTGVDPVIVSPQYATDHTVYAAVPAGGASKRGLYRSTDGGATWTLVPGSQAITVLTFVLSPSYATDHTLFVGTLEHGVLISTDGGQSLAQSSLADPDVTAMAISPFYATDHTIFAATYGGMWHSTDGAQTWSKMPTDALHSPLDPGILRTGIWLDKSAPGAACDLVADAAQKGDTLTLRFHGSRVSWISSKGPFSGTAEVFIDGVLQTTADLYAPSYTSLQTVYQSGVMPSQTHTIQIVVTGQHDPSSHGVTVTLNALEVAP